MAAPSSSRRDSNRQESSRWDWRSALAGALITALGLGVVVLLWQRPTPPPVVVHPPPPALGSNQPAVQASTAPPSDAASATPTAMLVFVSGAVQAPGVYSLEPNARVADALAAAGGLRDDANPAAVNQAAPLQDGDQVHVPTQDEAPVAPPAGVSAAPSAASAIDEPVNINTASAAELQTLPGIGPAKAEAIIANRPYASVDELDRVPGIGPATLEELRPLVRVQ